MKRFSTQPNQTPQPPNSSTFHRTGSRVHLGCRLHLLLHWPALLSPQQAVKPTCWTACWVLGPHLVLLAAVSRIIQKQELRVVVHGQVQHKRNTRSRPYHQLQGYD